MRLVLFHNPTAGDGTLAGEALVALFEAAGHAVDYRDTDAEAVEPAAAARAEAVVVAGGDGTVEKVVRALGAACRPLAIVPTGTANNIARALGLPGEAAAVAAGIARWVERPFDVGVAEGPWGRRLFLEGVGLGAFAEMIAAGDALGDAPGHDEDAFAADGPAAFLRRAAPGRWRAALDGRALPDELLFLEALNVPDAGPRLRLVGDYRPGDGQLDVVSLGPEGRDAMIAWTAGDRRAPPAAARRLRGAELAFDWAGGTLRIDDEFPKPPAAPVRVTVRLAADRLGVLMPQEEAR